jgi:hypothetical protein
MVFSPFTIFRIDNSWDVLQVSTDVARGVFDTPGTDDPWNYQQVLLREGAAINRFQTHSKRGLFGAGMLTHFGD